MLVCGCAESPREHTLRIWGEAYVEEEIPAADVIDGWSIVFDEFLVAVGEIHVVADGGVVDLPGWYAFDLTVPSGGAGFEVAAFEATGELQRVDYRLGRPGEIIGGNATPEQAARLVADRTTLSVRGHATRSDEVYTFAWDFALELGSRCALGQAIATPGDDGPVITIHADHLLLDDLELAPDIAFDAIAEADADGDYTVTREELANVDISAFPRYQSGSYGIPDLWNYIGHLAGTLGHIDGEGGCDPEYVPDDYRALEPPSHGEHAPALFEAHCAACHGSDGQGAGPLGQVSWPTASDLTRLPPSALDQRYLYFRILEGGAFFPYNSAMPAFESLITEDEAWELVAHVHALNAG
ncbi:MAG: cytochrome c [Nannocystaceae bacterium]|nr:cytochrome c [Myxococcales bacterium]